MLTFRWFSLYQKYDKNDYSNYPVISLYSTACKCITRRFQFLRGLRRGSADARLLECGIESCRGFIYMSFVSIVCQVEVSASD